MVEYDELGGCGEREAYVEGVVGGGECCVAEGGGGSRGGGVFA